MKSITKQTIKNPLKFVVVGILIGALIGAIFMGVFAQSPSSTFTISGGVYPGAPSYTIWNEGSDYFAKDANGLLAYSGTNASQIITSCVGSHTNIYFIVGANPIVLDSPIIVPDGTHFLTFEGKNNYHNQLYLEDSSDCDMFIIQGDCDHITFFNLGLFGNKYGQTAMSNGITYVGGRTTDSTIQNCMVTNFSGHAVYFESEFFAGLVIDNYFENCVNSSIRAEGLINTVIRNNYFWYSNEGVFINATTYSSQDNVIIGNLFTGNTNQAIEVWNSSGNLIANNWFNENGRGVYIHNSRRNTVQGNSIKSTTQCGVYVYNSNETVISNNEILGSSYLDDNTYDGIWIGSSTDLIGGFSGGSSQNNIITGNVISSIDFMCNSKYGIDELAGYFADYNIIIGNTVTGAQTANILLHGTYTKCSLCYNGTVWIP